MKRHPKRPLRVLIRAVGLLSTAIVVLTIVGCNATKGLGRDLEESSDNVKGAASK